MKMDPDQMRHAAVAAEAMLKALANRHRVMILCRLCAAEHSVGELATYLDLRDSTVSQHLSLLRKDGLVSARREGQTVWYRIADTAVRRMIETLYRIYCTSAQVCTPAKRPKGRAGSETSTKRKVTA